LSSTPSAAATRRAKILRRTRVGGSLALGLSLLLWGLMAADSVLLVLLVAALLGILTASEGGGLLARQPQQGRLLGALAGLVAAGLWWLELSGQAPWPQGQPILPYALAALAAGLVTLPLKSRAPAAPRWALPNWFWMGWIAAPLAGLAGIYAHQGGGDSGGRLLIALILLSKIGDTAGYYGGNAFGRRHPFPNLSPGKTLEGCLCSLLAAQVTGLLLCRFAVLPLTLAGGLVFSSVINLAAQAGDLLESRLKRSLGVKDSGSLFGPSGGFLDLVDSLLMSVPAALLLWPLLT
jgi:phosphatidate cytidylyltransferase